MSYVIGQSVQNQLVLRMRSNLSPVLPVYRFVLFHNFYLCNFPKNIKGCKNSKIVIISYFEAPYRNVSHTTLNYISH